MAYEEAYLALAYEEIEFCNVRHGFSQLFPQRLRHMDHTSVLRELLLSSPSKFFAADHLEKLMIFHHCVYCMECKNNPERLQKRFHLHVVLVVAISIAEATTSLQYQLEQKCAKQTSDQIGCTAN